MKNVLLIILLLTAPLLAFAQPQIPNPVLLAFEELHPTIEDPLWEKREGALVATFNDGDGLKKVFFSQDGQWQETRLRIGRASLPEGVDNFINRHYAQADVTFLAKVFRGSDLVYRVESELPGAVVVKELDEHGNLLREDRIRFDAQLAPDAGPGL